jgi:uncharacterized protein YecT (DUF1311 family)
MKNLSFLILCLYCTYSHAGNQAYNRCIEDRTKLSSECAKLEYEVHSTRLKKAMNTVMNLSHINKQNLLKQQEKWLRYRDQACPKNTQTGAATSYWQRCLARLTNSRATEVEQLAKKPKP